MLRIDDPAFADAMRGYFERQLAASQEITPELIPTEEGAKPQATEDSVGPYNLQDFTLALVVRHGFRPRKIAFLAWHAWKDLEAGEWPPGFPTDARVAYSLEEVRTWLVVFVKRFFANQFKRSALPNGPKVSPSGTMSPRGDWRMPSDAKGTAWLAGREPIDQPRLPEQGYHLSEDLVDELLRGFLDWLFERYQEIVATEPNPLD